MNTLKVGDKIPTFECLDDKENLIKSENFRGSKLVVFFYPRANTPGCTAQSCNLNDNYAKLTSQGYEIIGVSPDTVDKQNKFAGKYGFKYNLLADDSKELIKAFGVWGKKKFRGNEYEGVLRTTFIIDEEGIIERVIDKVKTKEHADQILD